MMMPLLCVYRGCEKQGQKGNDDYRYYSQTEKTLNNELDLVREKIGISPNK